MGTVYKKGNRWRVQIRHKGYKNISKMFTSKIKAKAFNELVEEAFERELEALTIKNASKTKLKRA